MEVGSLNSVLSILIVEDHPLTRLGLRRFLESQNWPCCDSLSISEAASVHEAHKLTENRQFTLAIIDLHLGDGNGLTLSQELLKKQSDLRILFYTGQQSSALDPSEFLRSGGRGFLTKNMESQTLYQAIVSVYYGGYFFGSESINPYQQQTPQAASDGSQLSRRETQVLKLLAEDFSKNEIAEQLQISVRTVETYRTRLMKKLDIHSLAGLIRYALEQGIANI